MHCSNIILKRAREGVVSDAPSEPGDTQAVHATLRKRIQSYSQGFPLAAVRCFDYIFE